MASPSPFFNRNSDSLNISLSPTLPPIASQLQDLFEQHFAGPRIPSLTLPPLIPTLQPRPNIPAQPDPTLYQNQLFSTQGLSLGSRSGGSRQQQQLGQPQGQPQTQNFQPSFSSPRLPSPAPTPLTPSRFDLPNGENYLTSTPEGGWNFGLSDDLGFNNAQDDFLNNWQDEEFWPYEPPVPNRNGEIDLTNTSPIMPRGIPNSRKRSAPSASTSASASASREEPSISPPPKRTKTSPKDPFASDSPKDDVDEVDLVGVNDDEDYAEAQKKRAAEAAKRKREEESLKPVRLAEQQCVICLDQPEGLTVTHCGHMFCAECLHGALNSNMMGKRVCPVCRSTINTTKNKSGQMPKNGVFLMEMKLQTRKGGKMARKS